MIRLSRKGGCRILLLVVFLVILTTYLLKKEQYLGNEGDCIQSLSFIVEEGAVEEVLIPFYSESEDIYYLFLPSYSNAANVSLYFEGADKVIFEGMGETHELRKNMKIQSLQFDQVYQASFVKNLETEAKIQFEIMHSANIPTLYITTESGSMENVDADKEFGEAGNCVLIDADGTLVCADELSHISGRGNSTWYYPKKSYGIKLKEEADLLGMGSARSWILLSNVEDNTYLRNKITYDMAIEVGMTGAPESRYVDLYLNNEYHGMYLLCEKIEAGENRIPMADLNLENEKYNKNIENVERIGTEEIKSVMLKINPKDISGGYILERDVYVKYNSEVSGFQTAVLGNRYTIKSPEYASVEETAYIHNLVDEMEKAIVSENGTNPDTGKSFTEYIDLQSFAQKYIIEELCKNNGGGATSSYFYKPNDDISNKIFAGPVWDYDKAYGRIYGFDGTTRDLCYMTQRTEGTTLFWHLSRQPEFQEAVKECYRDFFSDYIIRIVDEKIVEYASEIYASADMDAIRWKEIYGEVCPYGERSYPIKDFLMQRKEFLDEVWLNDAEICTVHFVAPEFYRDTYMSVIKGESLTAIPMQDIGEESDGIIFDGWYTEDGEVFDMNKPIYEDMTVYAKYCN